MASYRSADKPEPKDGAAERTDCLTCGEGLTWSDRTGCWVHTESGRFLCHPEQMERQIPTSVG